MAASANPIRARFSNGSNGPVRRSSKGLSSKSVHDTQELPEVELRRLRDVRLQHRLNLLQRMIIFFDGVRDGAVGGNDQVIVAHVGVVRAEEDADVPGDAGEDERARPEI